jgi:hypothetical protein
MSYFPLIDRGKLPGLFGGVKLSGGEKEGLGETGMSLRLMWRKDGQMEAYAYAPIKKSDELAKLSDSHVNEKFGTSLMRGRTSLIRGQTNTVTLYAKMNDVGKANGIVSLTVNGQTSSMDIVTLRTNADLKFSGIFFSTFFGGGDKSWATTKEEKLVFSDFAIQ